MRVEIGKNGASYTNHVMQEHWKCRKHVTWEDQCVLPSLGGTGKLCLKSQDHCTGKADDLSVRDWNKEKKNSGSFELWILGDLIMPLASTAHILKLE